uniref:Uncharacterized protein n=1 Tax=Nelumbo nucifera TaxID=4432 RepID=A0A822YP17_NELNU|nr:TPA_asm: hypothetical protein HUJ06_011447 [Nelumbo nucifera]
MALASKRLLLLGIVLAIIPIICPLESIPGDLGGGAPPGDHGRGEPCVLPPPICTKYDWVCFGASETSTPAP